MKPSSVKEATETVVEPRPATVKTAPAVAQPAEPESKPHGQIFWLRTAIFAVILAALALIVVLASTHILSKNSAPQPQAAENNPPADPDTVTIDPSQVQSIHLTPAASQAFRAEKVATGKIAFNEDVMTPVFSPYTGRILRLLAKPGDVIKQGSPLCEIDTPDLVQAETDLITNNIALAKSNAALELTRRTEDRQHRLYLNKAVALKDWEQAEADVKSAERDVHSTESALAGARAHLRVFGKTDAEIARIESDRQVDRMTRVLSPISGTITARKVGPGQYVKPDNPDPLFTIADLSTTWLLADVYESDVPMLKVGQPVEVSVAAYPGEVFTARVSYISPAVDPNTHRVAVRSTIDNRGQRLKPEMFASFHITTNAKVESLAVPVNAVVHDGSKSSVWVAQGSNQFVRREVTLGLNQDGYAQVISGLQPGEKVVAEGGLFLANAANMQD